jgi:hypothetical protein
VAFGSGHVGFSASVRISFREQAIGADFDAVGALFCEPMAANP